MAECGCKTVGNIAIDIMDSTGCQYAELLRRNAELVEALKYAHRWLCAELCGDRRTHRPACIATLEALSTPQQEVKK